MSLHPDAKILLDVMPPMDVDTLDAPTLRQSFAQMAGAEAMAEPPPSVAEVRDLQLPGPAGPMAARLYRPRDGILPAVIYFHGGGFVIGDLEIGDVLCRMVAAAANCVVVSVDYRLAPEARYPAAAEDCYAATCQVVAQASQLGVDPQRLAVMGDSAGGNLAAVTCIMARDRGGPQISCQALIYPVIDSRCDSESFDQNAKAPLLSDEMMRWFWRQYLEKPESGEEPYASPLKDGGTGLPGGIAITAGHDVLRDEGQAYARKLQAQGSDMELAHFEDMFHGFVSMMFTPGLKERTEQAIARISERLQRAFQNS